MLARIFELFAQGEPTAWTASQGGWASAWRWCKRLVELHGGTVEADSAGPGRGSEFVVRLPLNDVETAAPGAKHEAGRRREPPAAEGRRVLVVDDNEDVGREPGDAAAAAGHEVRVAHDGPAALAQADEFGPDVVLLDIGLPGMDGCEVARRLRAPAAGREALLVAVTGCGQDEDRRRSREAGFDHHLVKPADLRVLDELLAPRG